jgi:hypothetical protein
LENSGSVQYPDVKFQTFLALAQVLIPFKADHQQSLDYYFKALELAQNILSVLPTWAISCLVLFNRRFGPATAKAQACFKLIEKGIKDKVGAWEITLHAFWP